MSDENRSRSGGNQPISRHPLFPAIVALWVGALFGLASLAIAPLSVERAVLAFGVDKVVPMATPPLGTTTRILIALAMTAIGVVVGALIARALARRGENHRAAAPSEADRPAEGPAAQSRQRIAGRRRELTIQPDPAETDRPEPPVTQGSPILNVTDFDLDSLDPALPFNTASATVADAAKPGFDFLARPKLAPPVDDEETAEDTPIAAPSIVQRHIPETAPKEIARANPARPGRMAAERIASAGLDELSPIELLERLALAMARQREEARTAAVAQVDEPDVLEDNTRPTVEEARAEPSVELPRLPAALRPAGSGAPGDENEDALPGYIPPRHIGLNSADKPAKQTGGADDEGPDLAQGYSSLLDLSRPNPEQPPANERPFDAPAASDPDDTEKALREALATLQRMSGAA